MSSTSIYVGRWWDYSQGSTVLGDVITLDVLHAFNLISALSVWVTLVGGAVWALCSLAIHQYLAKDRNEDAFRIQQRVLFANPNDSFGIIKDLLLLCWTWRPSKGPSKIKGRKLRTISLILPAATVFAGFTVAAVYVSNVAGESYLSNNVLLKPANCGTFVYNQGAVSGNRALYQRIINDTLIGRAYADSCYGPNQDHAKCGLFPTPAILYDASHVSCPFGNDPSGSSLCIGNQAQAFQVTTGLMDTNDVLGINAAPENRILVQKSVTCSPINITSYITSNGGLNPIETLDLGVVFGISNNHTYRYNTQVKSDGFGYQLFTIEAGPEIWTPIEPLTVRYGDVGLVVLTSNSIRYLAPVEDPWFSANTPADPGNNLSAEYVADNNITAMGCVDKMQVCNPFRETCTVLSGWLDTFNNYQSIGLNEYQKATAWRLIQALGAVATFWSINGLGDNGILARRNVIESISSGLPADQWQTEVRGWFETSLAKLQAYVIGYVDHTEDLVQDGTFYTPDPDGLPIEQAAASFCYNQRVRNTGGYQTFSVLGIMVVVWLGLMLCIGSVIAAPVLGWIRRHVVVGKSNDHREVARIADGSLQLLMAVLRNSDPGKKWERTLRETPVTSERSVFPPPERHFTAGAEYLYYKKV